MGFFDTLLKDKKMIEIMECFFSNPGTIIFFEIGQQIRNGETVESFDREGITCSIEIIRNYATYQSEDNWERVVKALALYSVVKFGYDSKQYNPNELFRYAEQLYISITGTPDMFKVEHMPVIENLGNQLLNKKENMHQEKVMEKSSGQIDHSKPKMVLSDKVQILEKERRKKTAEKVEEVGEVEEEAEEEIYEVSRKVNKNGTTTFRYADKTGFTGSLDKNEQWHGLGTFYVSGKKKYVGEFKKGYFDGLGTFYFDDGGKHIGEFKKNNREGYGLQIDENGDILAGIWENDEYLDESMLGRLEKWLDKFDKWLDKYE